MLRWMRAALGGVSGAGVVPVSTGTAPPGVCLARRAPCTPLATPVRTAAAISPSLASRAPVRCRQVVGFVSVKRAAVQPSAAAPRPTALTAL